MSFSAEWSRRHRRRRWFILAALKLTSTSFAHTSIVLMATVVEVTELYTMLYCSVVWASLKRRCIACAPAASDDYSDNGDDFEISSDSRHWLRDWRVGVVSYLVWIYLRICWTKTTWWGIIIIIITKSTDLSDTLQKNAAGHFTKLQNCAYQ